MKFLLIAFVCLAVVAVSAIPVEHIPGLLAFDKKAGSKHARDFHYHNPDSGEYYRLKYDLETTGETFVNPRPEDGVNGLICHKVRRNDVMVSFNSSEYAQKWFTEAKEAHILTTMHPVECHDGPVLIRIKNVEMFGPRLVRVNGQKIKHYYEFLKKISLRADTNMRSVHTKERHEDTWKKWINDTHVMKAEADKAATPLPAEYYKDPELYRRRVFEASADKNEQRHLANHEIKLAEERRAAKAEMQLTDEDIQAYHDWIKSSAAPTKAPGAEALSEEEHHERAMKALGSWSLECSRKLFGRCVWYGGVAVGENVVNGPIKTEKDIGLPQAVQERITLFISQAITGQGISTSQKQRDDARAEAEEAAREEKDGIYNLDKFFESATPPAPVAPGTKKMEGPDLKGQTSVSGSLTTQFSFTGKYKSYETTHLQVQYNQGSTQLVKVWKDTEWVKTNQFHIVITGGVSVTHSWPLFAFSFTLCIIGIAGLFGLGFTLTFDISFDITFSITAKWEHTRIRKSTGYKMFGHQYTPATRWQRISEKSGPTDLPWRFDKKFHYCSAFAVFATYANTDLMQCSKYCMASSNCRVFRIKNAKCELSNQPCGDEKWDVPNPDNNGVTGVFENLQADEPANGFSIEFKLTLGFTFSVMLKVTLGSFSGLGLGGPYLTISFGFEFVATVGPRTKWMYVTGDWDQFRSPANVVYKSVITTDDGLHVWSLDTNNNVYYREGLGNLKLAATDASGWIKKDGASTVIAVSGDGNNVWGITALGKAQYRAGVSGTWTAVASASTFKSITVSQDGSLVYAVDAANKIFKRFGKGDVNNNAAWIAVACPVEVVQVAVSGDKNHLWAVGKDNTIRYLKSTETVWVDKSDKQVLKTVSVNTDGSLVCAVGNLDTFCRYGVDQPWLKLSESGYDPKTTVAQSEILKKVTTVAVSGDGEQLWAVTAGSLVHRPVGSKSRIAAKRFTTTFDINFFFDISCGIKIKIEIEIDLKVYTWKKTLFEADLVAFTLFSVKVPFYRLELTSNHKSVVINTREYKIDQGTGLPIQITTPSTKDSIFLGTPTPPSSSARGPVLAHSMKAQDGGDDDTPVPTQADNEETPVPTQADNDAPVATDATVKPTKVPLTPKPAFAFPNLFTKPSTKVPEGPTAKAFLSQYASVDAWSGSCDSDVFVYRVNVQYISKQRFVIGYDVSHSSATCSLKGLYQAAPQLGNRNTITLNLVDDKAFARDTCWMQDIPKQLKAVPSENGGFVLYNRWGYCGDIALRKSSSLTLMKRGQSIEVDQSLAASGSRLSITPDGNVELMLIETDQILYESNTISAASKGSKRLQAKLLFNTSGDLIVQHSYKKSFSTIELQKVIGGHPDGKYLEITECDLRMYGGSDSAPNKEQVLWSATGRDDCRELLIEKDHPKWHRGGNILYVGEILNENSGLYNSECIFEHEFGRAHILRYSTLESTWSTAGTDEQDLRRDTVVFTLLWNGNLALIDKQGKLRWESKTAGSEASHVVLEGCKLVLYKKVSGVNKVIWTADGGNGKPSSFFNERIPELPAPRLNSRLKTPHMEMGDYLLPGQSIVSKNAILIHQPNGNVALYQRTSTSTTPIWSTNTAGQCTKAFAFTHDGNLGLYACPGTVAAGGNPQIWSTGALDSRPMMVGLGDSCVLKLYSQAYRGTFNPESVIKSISDTKCNTDATVAVKDFREVYGSIPRGTALTRGQATFTQTIGLVNQPNGDVVLFEYVPRTKTLWRSNTVGSCTSEFTLVDNNVVILDCNGTVAWSALKATSSLLRGGLDTVGTNITISSGALRLINAKNKVVWTSPVNVVGKPANPFLGKKDKGESPILNDEMDLTSSEDTTASNDNHANSARSSIMSSGVMIAVVAAIVVAVAAIVTAVKKLKSSHVASSAPSMAMLSP